MLCALWAVKGICMSYHISPLKYIQQNEVIKNYQIHKLKMEVCGVRAAVKVTTIKVQQTKPNIIQINLLQVQQWNLSTAFRQMRSEGSKEVSTSESLGVPKNSISTRKSRTVFKRVFALNRTQDASCPKNTGIPIYLLPAEWSCAEGKNPPRFWL